jgi:hypothetical protein
MRGSQHKCYRRAARKARVVKALMGTGHLQAPSEEEAARAIEQHFGDACGAHELADMEAYARLVARQGDTSKDWRATLGETLTTNKGIMQRMQDELYDTIRLQATQKAAQSSKYLSPWRGQPSLCATTPGTQRAASTAANPQSSCSQSF